MDTVKILVCAINSQMFASLFSCGYFKFRSQSTNIVNIPELLNTDKERTKHKQFLTYTLNMGHRSNKGINREKCKHCAGLTKLPYVAHPVRILNDEQLTRSW